MEEEVFSASAPAERIASLVDNGSLTGAAQHGTLHIASGTIEARQVNVIATNRHAAGGSLGVIEAKAISAILEQSSAAHHAVILCLDSAGARLDEGLAALGAFRQLYRHMLDSRLAGLPTLALIGRHCFGGASMLATTCSQRVYSDASRLAMSGPAVIQALGGSGELDANDAFAVTLLMGGAARTRMSPADHLCDDTHADFRRAARNWIVDVAAAPALDLRQQHTRLGKRLLAHGMAPSPPTNARDDLPAVLQEILPPGIELHTMDGVLFGRSKSSPNAFFGLIEGNPVGALTVWTLAGECLAVGDQRPGEAVTIFLDCPGQAPTFRDELVMLSEYVSHLALVLASLRRNGHRVTLQLLGDAAGGIYVALAAPAARVLALPGANVQILPPAAIARVLRRRSASTDVEDYMRAGVVDTLI
ncbi:MAG: biotin-independent malonate decarboxylase subunit gamma [Burkholderiales bacterium]|jgi:hypothetical protein